MNLDLTYYHEKTISNYVNKSQIARIVTENWCTDNLYCAFCDSDKILPYEKNKKVYDYYCSDCGENYQLKSKKNKLGNSILDGAYTPMINAIKDGKTPNFLLMSYFENFEYVKDLVLIPRNNILEENIEPRKPLSINARRAGWIGCYINIQNVTNVGKVSIIDDCEVIEIKEVRKKAKTSTQIFNEMSKDSSWINDILLVIEKQNDIFTLADVYKYEFFFQNRHQSNNNIQAKIRQKLQVARNLGIIEFTKRGEYKKLCL